MRQAALVQRLQVVVLTRGPLGSQLLGGDGGERGSCNAGAKADKCRGSTSMVDLTQLGWGDGRLISLNRGCFGTLAECIAHCVLPPTCKLLLTRPHVAVRHLPERHDVQDHAEAVHVRGGRGGGGAVGQHLWRQQHHGGPRGHRVVGGTWHGGEAHVRDTCREAASVHVGLGHQHVGGLRAQQAPPMSVCTTAHKDKR